MGQGCRAWARDLCFWFRVFRVYVGVEELRVADLGLMAPVVCWGPVLAVGSWGWGLVAFTFYFRSAPRP